MRRIPAARAIGENRQPFAIRDSAMRDASTIAIGELYQGIRHEHWHGKTYRDFWRWFNDRCIQIVGAAESGELDALHAALMDVRAAVEEAGYAVSSDRLDERITPAD